MAPSLSDPASQPTPAMQEVLNTSAEVPSAAMADNARITEASTDDDEGQENANNESAGIENDGSLDGLLDFLNGMGTP